MGDAFEKRLLVVWLALSIVTVAQLGVGAASASPSAVVAAGAIGIALVKVRLILREFMEVRHAPVLLGRLTDSWLVVTAVALFCGHVAGTLSSGG